MFGANFCTSCLFAEITSREHLSGTVLRSSKWETLPILQRFGISTWLANSQGLSVGRPVSWITNNHKFIARNHVCLCQKVRSIGYEFARSFSLFTLERRLHHPQEIIYGNSADYYSYRGLYRHSWNSNSPFFLELPGFTYSLLVTSLWPRGLKKRISLVCYRM